VRPTRVKTRCRGIRLDEPLIASVERAAREGGFSNPSAFIRAAIQRELAGRESEVEAAEDRIAASLDRLGREIRSIKLAQQASSHSWTLWSKLSLRALLNHRVTLASRRLRKESFAMTDS
jgi:Arc/MetJ-type ribon-helix-helix transcriptional regulator